MRIKLVNGPKVLFSGANISEVLLRNNNRVVAVRRCRRAFDKTVDNISLQISGHTVIMATTSEVLICDQKISPLVN
jgi:hypothetical protein